jgi:hypothetical protein
MTFVGPQLRPHVRIQEPAAVEVAALSRALRISLAAVADLAMGAPDAGRLLQRLHAGNLAARGARATGFPRRLASDRIGRRLALWHRLHPPQVNALQALLADASAHGSLTKVDGKRRVNSTKEFINCR